MGEREMSEHDADTRCESCDEPLEAHEDGPLCEDCHNEQEKDMEEYEDSVDFEVEEELQRGRNGK